MDLLPSFAVVFDEKEEEEESLGSSLELLDLVSILDFPMAVEQVVGGWVAKGL